MKALRQLLSGSWHIHTWDSTHTRRMKQVSSEFVSLYFTFNSIQYLMFQLVLYPSFLFDFIQTCTQDTGTDTQHTHGLWKGLSNGIWRFQFPLCHQRQKTHWAQLPLSYTHPDETTRTHTLGHILACNHRNKHTSMHTLSLCDTPRIT